MHEEKKIELSYEISNLGNKTLKDEIEKYTKKHKKIFCKWLNRRPVFIENFLEYSQERWGSDENHRRKAFFPAMELLHLAEVENLTNKVQEGWCTAYEFKWVTPKWRLVWVHIKDFTEAWDKILRLISIFWKE